jgi:hypothetical protein
MHVMARETWTDERLDDLTKRVDEGFRETKVELLQLRKEMTAESASRRKELGEVRNGLGELNAEVKGLSEKMDAGFEGLNRTLQISFSLIGVVLAGLMGLIGTQL